MAVNAPKLYERTNPRTGRTEFKVSSKNNGQGKFFASKDEAIRQYNRYNPNNQFTVKEQAKLSGGLSGQAQTALDNARRAEGTGRFKGTTAEAIDNQFGIGKESGNTSYYRALEAEGKAGASTAYRNDYIGMNQNPITNGAQYEEDLARLFNERDAKIALDNAKRAEQAAGASTAFKNEQVGMNLNPITDGAKYEADIAKACDEKFGKLAEDTGKTGFFGKIGNWIKNNKGKAALIAVGIGLLGAGLAYLLTRKDDKKAEEVPAEQEVVQEEVPAEEVQPEEVQPEETVVPPVVPEEEDVQPEEVQPEEEVPAEEVPDNNNSNGNLVPGQTIDIDGKKYTVKKGDNFWKLALNHLQEENPNFDYVHNNEDNKKLLELTNKLMTDNGYKLADDNYHSYPPIYPGDQLDLKF